MKVERAVFVAWWDLPQAVPECDRIYFGHETCEHLLPAPSVAADIHAWARSHGKSLSLVTPFLTDSGLHHALQIVERLVSEQCALEVICGDWGLLHELRSCAQIRPVVGRLLAAQPVDPRLARVMDNRPLAPRPVEHLNGTRCELRKAIASPALKGHLQGTWLSRQGVQDFLRSAYGVPRAEVNSPVQGLNLEATDGWSFSLHVDEILISVMRTCPAIENEFHTAGACCTGGCDEAEQLWQSDHFPVPIIRRGNGLFVKTSHPLHPWEELPIDRLVWRYSAGIVAST